MNKEKELLKIANCAMCIANEEFGIDGWSHSVSHQSIDYIEHDEEVYEVGVSALVKVMLKDGSFHEDVGFGVVKDRKSKGNCIARARKIAANDALVNSLRGFGSKFQNLAPSGKIISFLSPSQVYNGPKIQSTGSAKRKLVLLDSNGQSDKEVEIEPDISFVSKSLTCTLQCNNPNRLRAGQAPTQANPLNDRATMASSKDGQEQYVLPDVQNNADQPFFEDPQSSTQGVALEQRLTAVAQSAESPSNAKKSQRKLKQLQLEIEAREELKNKLLLRMYSLENSNFDQHHSIKKEPDDFHH